MKKSLFFASLLAGLLLVGCSKGETSTDNSSSTSNQTSSETSSSEVSSSEVSSSEATETLTTKATLNAENLSLGDKYKDGTATVDGVDFEYIELYTKSNGIQMRHENPEENKKTSIIKNTTAFADGIKAIKITLNADKTGHANEGALKITAGDEAGAATEELLLNTEKGVAEYTLKFTKAYKFITITHNFKYTLYVDSFEYQA